MKTTACARRIRVLHIVGGMNRGGIETWLMHVLRRIDRDRFQMDFMVHTGVPCPYDDEVRTLGARILPCLGHPRPWSYAKNFRRVLAAYGPYDVVHSHVQHYNGFTLYLACRAGVPVRIAHSHLDDPSQGASLNSLRRIYLAVMRYWIRRCATSGLAASGKAAEALFGPRWPRSSACRLLYCGIDTAPFHAEPDRSLRADLRLPSDAFVIGHVGRFVEQKNHAFLLEIVRRLADIDSRTRLLLIGDGPLRSVLERRAAELGLSGHVVFTGLRSDVPRVLLGAVDAFVMPSLYEGLPLVGIEAQAAGLPCILSDAITPELDVLPELIRRLPLSAPASVWADQVLATRHMAGAVIRGRALAAMAHSPFNIERSVTQLESIYDKDRIRGLAAA